MTTLILRTTAALLHPLLLLYSVFLLLRGHDEPGGGFSGGLVAAAAMVLHALAEGPAAARRLLRVDPRRLAVVGLAVSTLSGLVGMLSGASFLTGRWAKLPLPGLGALKLGTPVLFDVGVYLVVLGVATTVVLTLMEED
jgi:multicomponent Na+:H+ antiporter subunit B